MEPIEERKNLRSEFLHRAYEYGGGDARHQVDGEKLGAVLNLDDRDVLAVIQYLEGENLIEVLGDMTVIRLTHAGVMHVEKALTQQKEPAGLVFVSYSHSDGRVADDITAVLEELGIHYFRDVRAINWGDSISASVRGGLDAAAAVIVILSPGSLKSHWVSFEVGYSVALQKRVLPYLTHPDLDPPDFLRDLSYASTPEEIRAFFSDSPNWGSPPISPGTQDTVPHRADEFREVAALMPALLGEMKEDLEDADNQVVREFVPLQLSTNSFNHGDKRRFEYYGDKHEELQNKIDLLAARGFVQVARYGQYDTNIYRMTEEFVRLLRNWTPST